MNLNELRQDASATLRIPQHISLAPARARRTYIAGPMTGYPDFNYPAFNAAAAQLRAAGIAAINPADHGVVPGAVWEDHLRSDLAQLATCESIYFLPGWSKSRGALLEHHVATSLGMTLIFAADAEKPAGQCVDVMEAAIGTPPAQAVDLGPLRRLYEAYVRLLESGRDRIIDLGGSCDPVDVMERSDADLIEARALIYAQAVQS